MSGHSIEDVKQAERLQVALIRFQQAERVLARTAGPEATLRAAAEECLDARNNYQQVCEEVAGDG